MRPDLPEEFHWDPELGVIPNAEDVDVRFVLGSIASVLVVAAFALYFASRVDNQEPVDVFGVLDIASDLDFEHLPNGTVKTVYNGVTYFWSEERGLEVGEY